MRLSLRMAACAVLAFASTAQGQATSEQTRTGARPFSVTPRGGYIMFDDASGIKDAAALGLDATYNITPMIAITGAATFSRPITNGDEFLGAMYLGAVPFDTTFLYRAQQPITVADLNIGARLSLPLTMARISPYVQGGIGGYTLYLDPQASGQTGSRGNRVQRMSVTVGGGLAYRVSDALGISLDVRDMIFMNYDRERLNPVRPEARDTRFIEDFPAPPENKKTVHNIALQVGFTFVPSAGTEEEEGGQ